IVGTAGTADADDGKSAAPQTSASAAARTDLRHVLKRTLRPDTNCGLRDRAMPGWVNLCRRTGYCPAGRKAASKACSPQHPRMLPCLIGATGFEPATARPPAECATRLRHAPWSIRILGECYRRRNVVAASRHTRATLGRSTPAR